MADNPDEAREPGRETDLLAVVEQQKILAEDQPLAGHTVLATIFSEAWRGWLARFSAHCGTPVDALIADALARHAAHLGFSEPPPENG